MTSHSNDDWLYSPLENVYPRILENPDARRKAQLFGALLPAGCRSVLDIGGASGWATLVMRQRCPVVTLDRNLPSLVIGDGDRILADAAHLPFGDHSFDLVLSSQVLEHLPDSQFDEARAEMMRVTARFLLVSVPYREDLAARLVRCVYCGQVFHTDHHARAFDEQDLAVLFTGWTLAEWHVFGVLKRGSGLAFAKDISFPRRKQRVRPAPVRTVCPACGRQGMAAHQKPAGANRSRGGLGRMLFAGKRQLSRHLTSLRRPPFLPQALAPYWIAALYIPEGSASAIDGDLATLVLRD